MLYIQKLQGSVQQYRFKCLDRKNELNLFVLYKALDHSFFYLSLKFGPQTFYLFQRLTSYTYHLAFCFVFCDVCRLNCGFPWFSNTDVARCFFWKAVIENVSHFFFDCSEFRDNFNLYCVA